MANRERWRSKIAFVLAAAGSAVGIGNIWRFPYIVGNNGGGAFVLVYLACISCIGIPLLMVELFIGARSQAGAVKAFEIVHQPRSPWRWLGHLCWMTSFIILSFYCVIGGWILDFLQLALRGQLAHDDPQTVRGILQQLFASPTRQIAWHAVFTAVNAAVMACGFKKGLERAGLWLMPALVVILLLLLLHALFLPGVGQALTFLFRPDTSRLTAAGMLEAVGHSFFTLSIAMGIMLTYGSYLRGDESLGRLALSIALFDTLIALLVGIVIFSVAFSFGVETGTGPTLIFQTLPVLFAKLTGGWFVSTLFFLLVAFAALTSSLSLFELLVSLSTEMLGVGRKAAAFGVALSAFTLGIVSALSTNVLASWTLYGKTPFDLLDWVTSSLFLPVSGICFALFFGWVLGRPAVRQLLGERLGQSAVGAIFLWTVRVLVPGAICIVWVRGLLP
ncbi:MAG: sodium-dependent transporter [Myxococcota bacterium]